MIDVDGNETPLPEADLSQVVAEAQAALAAPAA